MGFLTFINIRGVRAGTRVSNLFTVAKLVPLFAVIVLGLLVLQSHHWNIAAAQVSSPSTSQWLRAMLLLVFAYGGFETALAPMGEAKNPRRDAPFALLTALLVCTAIYALIQWVVIGVLPDAALSQRPLADVARLAVGPAGAALVAIGALISFYGYLSAKILGLPRVPFALAEQERLPQSLRRRPWPLSYPLRFDSRVCASTLGIRPHRRIQMECNAFLISPPSLPRRRLRSLADPAPQAARRGNRNVPPARGRFLRCIGGGSMPDPGNARGLRPVLDPVRYDRIGIHKLGDSIPLKRLCQLTRRRHLYRGDYRRDERKAGTGPRE